MTRPLLSLPVSEKHLGLHEIPGMPGAIVKLFLFFSGLGPMVLLLLSCNLVPFPGVAGHSPRVRFF